MKPLQTARHTRQESRRGAIIPRQGRGQIEVIETLPPRQPEFTTMRRFLLTAAVLSLLGLATLPSLAAAGGADRAIRVQISANSSAQFFAQREARSPAIMLGRGAQAVARPAADRPAGGQNRLP